MNRGIDGIAGLLHYASTRARVDGLDLPVPLAHLLLTSLGAAGSRLVWRPEGSGTPRFARPSVTFLGGEGEHPAWYLQQCLPVVDWDEESRRSAGSIVRPHPTPAEIRQRRRHAERLRNMFPEKVRNGSLSETTGPGVCRTEFLIGVRTRVPRLKVPDDGFGHDRLVLMLKEEAYDAINRPSGFGPALKAAALNRGGGLRAVLNGWVPRRRFRRIVRKQPMGECSIYGWLLPSDPGPDAASPRGVWKASPSGILQHPLALRFLAPVSAYQPCLEIAARLDRADHEWRVPAWCDAKPLRSLLRLDEELAWQLAAVLRVIDCETPDRKRDFQGQAELAVALSQWIRAAHCREVRLLFPGPPGDPAERLSRDVADRLLTKSRGARELYRGIRGSKAADVRRVLERMASEGWVTEGKGKWSLDFPPLPEVSTKLSIFAGRGQNC